MPQCGTHACSPLPRLLASWLQAGKAGKKFTDEEALAWMAEKKRVAGIAGAQDALGRIADRRFDQEMKALDTLHSATEKTKKKQAKERFILVKVEMSKQSKDDKFGIGVGLNDDDEHVVSKVVDGGLGAKKVQVKDTLLKINGLNASAIDHEKVMLLLRTETKIKAEIRRRAPGGTKPADLFVWSRLKKAMVPLSEDTEEEDDLDAGTEMTEERVQELRTAFELFDTDSSGQISSDELRVAMHAMGFKPTDKELFDLINQVDKDGNGEIDFEEFRELYKILLEKGTSDVLGFGHAASGEVSTVTLKRPDLQASYGMAIADKEGFHLVTKVAGGGLADGKLQVGDIVRKLNGKDTALLSHAQLMQLVSMSKKLVLTVEHGDAKHTIQEDVAVKLTKSVADSSLGMGIGLNEEGHHAISKLAPGGLAAMSGSIEVGNVIKSVNGTDVYSTKMSHDDVLALMKKVMEVRMILGQCTAHFAVRAVRLFLRRRAFPYSGGH